MVVFSEIGGDKMNLNEILPLLKNVQNHNGQYQAQCPAHDDKTASLSLTEKNGKVLFHCHAGCHYSKVMDAIGITRPDKPTISKIYDYCNADRSLNFQVCRFVPKTFRQRKNENEWNMQGVEKTLYRLPELITANKSKLVFICEGEKDVDTLFENGFLATCNCKTTRKHYQAAIFALLPTKMSPAGNMPPVLLKSCKAGPAR
jgi:hypothetical protein